MTVVCEWCAVFINVANKRWPGYCSAVCRDLDRRERQARQLGERDV